MDIHTTANAVTMIRRLMEIDKPTQPVISAQSGKPAACRSEARYFPRVSPESVGVSSALLTDFLKALDADHTLDMHGVNVYRFGKCILEAPFTGYDRSVWHITYSECKTLTGLAVGLLIEEGLLSLDEKVTDIFGVTGLARVTHGAMTVRDLLTMRSGIRMNEVASATEENWTKCFFESAVTDKPGSKFNYNSINSYILSAIAQKKTGQRLDEYLDARLFAPLHITDYFWERSDEGITKGGWGLYIYPEDLAKIAQTMLDGGVFEGNRVLPEAWIREATRTHVTTGANYGNYDYGYHLWTGARGEYLFNGMFGQNVIVYPHSGIIVVSNAGNNEFFQQSNFFTVLERTFRRDFPADALPMDFKARHELKKLLSVLGRRNAFLQEPELFAMRKSKVRERAALFIGRRFVCPADKGGGMGLMPLFMQIMQNCYSGGLKAISFRMEDDFIVRFEEHGRAYDFPVGLDEPRETTLDFGAEQHRVAVTGRLTHNEDEVPVLKLRISFQEQAHARFIRLYLDGDSLRMVMDEAPGMEYFYEGLSLVFDPEKPTRLTRMLTAGKDSDIVRFAFSRVFRPEIILKEVKNETQSDFLPPFVAD